MNKRYTLTSLYILLLMTLGAVALVCGSLLLHYGNAALAVLTFAVSLSCFLLITIHHIRFIRWIRREAATAEAAERFRAEQAEVHVTELRHYIDELEQSAMALRESRERFRHAAYHDGLTGLGNRNKLLEIAERRLLERAGSNEFAVIFIDLDRFKTINDSLGHSIGDRLLVQVGERLVKCVGNPAAVARLGGDDLPFFLRMLNLSARPKRSPTCSLPQWLTRLKSRGEVFSQRPPPASLFQRNATYRPKKSCVMQVLRSIALKKRKAK